jgi:hypothetical protein
MAKRKDGTNYLSRMSRAIPRKRLSPHGDGGASQTRWMRN